MKYLLIIFLLCCALISNAQGGWCIYKWGYITTDCGHDSAFYAELNEYVAGIKMRKKPYLSVRIDSVVSIEYLSIIGFGKVQKKAGPYRLMRAACGLWITGPKDQLKFLIDYAIINRRFYKRNCNECHGIEK